METAATVHYMNDHIHFSQVYVVDGSAGGAIPTNEFLPDDAAVGSIRLRVQRTGCTFEDAMGRYITSDPQPFERRKLAEVLLSGAWDDEEYEEARREVARMGLDADTVPHKRP